MPELVSILIPAYNAERWLGATIRSALAQTWPRTEIIVVDDGSKDATLAIAKSWESRSVKVVAQPNMGAAAARNTALTHAQGTYIQWLDADDLLDPNKIRAQMRVASEIEDRRALLSCPFGTFYYRPEKAVFARTSLWRDLAPIDYLLTRFNENVCFQTDAWLVSRELTDVAGRWTDFGSPDDDGEYFCRAAIKSTVVKFVAGARSYYRIGDTGTLSKVRSQNAVRALYRSKVKCIGYLLSVEDSARTRDACLRLLQTWMPELHGHAELIAEAQRLAVELGGIIQRPVLKWKYRPVQLVCGYDAAVRTSVVLRRLRARAERKLDEMFYRMSSPGREEASGHETRSAETSS